MELRFCKSCGLLAPAASRACPRCGGELDPPQGNAGVWYRICPASAQWVEDDAEDDPQEPDGPAAERWEEWETTGEEWENMGTGRYLISLLLFAVPVVGLCVMLCWALGGTVWPERRHLAQAYLIKRILWDLLLLAAVLVIHSMLLGWLYAPMLIGGYAY